MNIGEIRAERDRLAAVVKAMDDLLAVIEPHTHTVKKAVNGTNGTTNGAMCAMRGCHSPVKFRGVCSVHYGIWAQSRDGWEKVAAVMLPSKTGSKGGKRG